MRISDWSSDVCSSDLAGTVAPDDVRRLAAAPHTGSIDHVVVEQRCRVDEFDGGGQLVMTGALIFQQFGASEGQHRPQPLAATGDQMAELGSASCRERVCQYV